MAGSVARATDNGQRLGRVGQREEQYLVAPVVLVGDVHTLLTLPQGGGQGPVPINDGLLEEFGRLTPPDPQPDLVDGVHQDLDVCLPEPAAEVPGGGWVGDPLGTQSVQVHLVVTEQFEVLHTLAPAQEVVGDVEHVVRLVVRLMHLQQMELLINGLHQAALPGQQVNGPDPAGPQAPGLVRQFVTDVAGSEHRPVLRLPLTLPQTMGDPTLAILQLSCSTGAHSKCLLALNGFL